MWAGEGGEEGAELIIDPLLLRLYAGDASAGIGQLAMLGASVGYYSPLAAEVVVG